MRGEDFTSLPPEDEADLVALADDQLSPARRAEVEARVGREPELAAALERQREALALISQLCTPAPFELRLRVEELKAARVRRRRRRRRWVPIGALGLAATAATVFAFVFATGGPAVGDALAVALRPATAPAVTGDHVGSAWFPESGGGWHATGARSDTVEGRKVRTVFYERDGRTIAYTIVDGPPLEEHYDGTVQEVPAPGGRTAVTWVNGGHTCLISGSGVDVDVLRHLAAWS
jgi:hypothetical protein